MPVTIDNRLHRCGEFDNAGTVWVLIGYSFSYHANQRKTSNVCWALSPIATSGDVV